ncbi:MAG: hypothetical protein LQ348_005095 [Seirophora lacunosa]|nr:MAG: hypothetical protein LQ344_003836 [Seirophora lacunosa]KAI4181061.1 MAG: hypothetical protein LQ348_005095 [Seirophora lacunosa]
MPAQSRGRQAVFSQSRSAPDLPPLGAFPITSACTSDEQTPRALRGLEQPAHPSSTDEENEDDEADEADFQSHYSLDASSSSDSSESDSESDDRPVDIENKHRPYIHRSSSSSFLSANAFAPPFYNKPPTPLPPSPSLTSLLRPSFSTTTSRPTTPDSSENDTPNDTEAAVAKSARIATTVPRASPKVPTYEYYGFVLYLMSFLVFALAAYNTEYLTLPMDSIENLVDEAANIAIIDHRSSAEADSLDRSTASHGEWAPLWSEGTDAVMDIPIGGVCEVLYGHG